LSLALTIPVVMLSPDVQMWFGYSLPALPGEQYIAMSASTIIVAANGQLLRRLKLQRESPPPATFVSAPHSPMSRAIVSHHLTADLANWGYRQKVTLARLRSLGLFAGLVFATLVAGHHLIYLFAHGAEHDHIHATSAAGHDSYWLLFLVAVVGAAIGIMALAVHELRRLARLAASTPSGAVVQDAGVAHLLGAWLPLFAKVGVATVVAFFLQENMELASVGAGFPGIGVLTGDHGVAIPVLLVVAAVIALAGALVRWRRDVLLARIRRAARPRPAATLVRFVAQVHLLVSADGGGSNGTRAPPIAGAASA
jgi:hypothetical protein